MVSQYPRRTAVGLAVACAATCAACTRYGPQGADAPPPTREAATGEVLGLAKDVPVGGGKVFAEQKVVVTQAVAGQYKGFSAICTHQGCVVGGVDDGVIHCDCHGSKFTLDGAVNTGPATTPLPPETVSVNAQGQLVLGAAGAATTTAPATTTEPPATTAETTEETTAPPAGGKPGLASTSQVPVGGGMVLADQEIVITQPTPGKYLAFSAVCTHQGCIVGDVKGGTINCNCHGSKFGLDGSVANGPAAAPLSARAVKVTGDQISLA